jgi:type II secretory ATPase GspE/PulE/Tfp pilus assembly ATPase PilB-like protein
MSDELRHVLLTTLDLGAIRQLVREQGMVTLKQDAWAKVQAGITTIEEVLRVVQD